LPAYGTLSHHAGFGATVHLRLNRSESCVKSALTAHPDEQPPRIEYDSGPRSRLSDQMLIEELRGIAHSAHRAE
jgi:hypothetical protein